MAESGVQLLAYEDYLTTIQSVVRIKLSRINWSAAQRFRYRATLAGQQVKESKMLVLSRQKDESIIIGDDIEITIVDVRGDKVRLGINAPREISVHRKEIYEAIQREKAQQKAAESAATGTGQTGKADDSNSADGE